MTAQLRVAGLRKRYKGDTNQLKVAAAVDNVSFEVQPGDMFTLLGPSGCGKTTTLRCIAGLEQPDEGSIVLEGRTLSSSANRSRLAPNERGIGMVFQSYAIWPHMNVFKNVAFPLQVRPRRTRPSHAEIRRRVEETLAVVQLDHLAARTATALSGGQQQRLALARALVMEPPLLLLDEPLSNLDAKLRERMRFELKSLQRRLGITALYVTHDQSEALTMSDVIAVMHQGRIEQQGTPQEIYGQPSSLIVAEFIGSSNIVKGIVQSLTPTGDGKTKYLVSTAAGEIAGIMAGVPEWIRKDSSVSLAIRPEFILLQESGIQSARPNHWRATVAGRAFAGEAVDYIVTVPSAEIKVRCGPDTSYAVGAAVEISVDTSRLVILPN